MIITILLMLSDTVWNQLRRGLEFEGGEQMNEFVQYLRENELTAKSLKRL
ncbi:hypothetical protein P5490_019905 [Bacillus altitudinis]